jgi:hypothetical protein
MKVYKICKLRKHQCKAVKKTYYYLRVPEDWVKDLEGEKFVIKKEGKILKLIPLDVVLENLENIVISEKEV